MKMSFKQKKIKFKPRIKLNHNIFVATLFYFSDYCSLYVRVETHEGLKSATLMCLLCPIAFLRPQRVFPNMVLKTMNIHED